MTKINILSNFSYRHISYRQSDNIKNFTSEDALCFCILNSSTVYLLIKEILKLGILKEFVLFETINCKGYFKIILKYDIELVFKIDLEAMSNYKRDCFDAKSIKMAVEDFNSIKILYEKYPKFLAFLADYVIVFKKSAACYSTYLNDFKYFNKNQKDDLINIIKDYADEFYNIDFDISLNNICLTFNWNNIKIEYISLPINCTSYIQDTLNELYFLKKIILTNDLIESDIDFVKLNRQLQDFNNNLDVKLDNMGFDKYMGKDIFYIKDGKCVGGKLKMQFYIEDLSMDEIKKRVQWIKTRVDNFVFLQNMSCG